MNIYFMTTDGQNAMTLVNGSQHDRNAGLALSLTPSEKFSMQLGYNYNDIFSSLLICFTSSAAQPGLPGCPGVAGLAQQQSPYDSKVNAGFVNCLWAPLPRVTLDIGANISTASGSQLNLNPLGAIPTEPTGALNSGWYQPYGSISYHFRKNWTGRARWDYYGYHEDSNGSYQDLYAPRNFRRRPTDVRRPLSFPIFLGIDRIKAKLNGVHLLPYLFLVATQFDPLGPLLDRSTRPKLFARHPRIWPWWRRKRVAS